MSDLTQLKSRLDSLARQAKSTGGQLSAYRQKFGQAIAEVNAAIGGSAQRKDQEVVAALSDAQAKVDAAVASLEAAARTAQTYGQSL